jgi:hypothetical protein
MATSTDPQDLTTLAACFSQMNSGQLLPIQTYLLAVMAGTSTDPAVLMAASSCFACLNPNQLLAISTYLLTQISGGSSALAEIYPLTGSNTPTATPAGGGLAYNEAGDVWIYSGGAWSKILTA